MSNKSITFGPVGLSNVTTTNVINPPTLTGGLGLHGSNIATYLIIRHIRIVNKTQSPIACAFWLGATNANVAGTEVIAGGQATGGALTSGTGLSVLPNSYVDWYGALRLDAADFLVGGAGSGGLTLQGEGEVGIA